MTPASWLATAVLTLVCVVLAMLLMAVGLVLGRRPLRASCGGGAACACGARPDECEATVKSP